MARRHTILPAHRESLTRIVGTENNLTPGLFCHWYLNFIFKGEDEDEVEEEERELKTGGGLVQQAPQDGVSWRCPSCRVVNSWTSRRCIACEGLAPHSVTCECLVQNHRFVMHMLNLFRHRFQRSPLLNFQRQHHHSHLVVLLFMLVGPVPMEYFLLVHQQPVIRLRTLVLSLAVEQQKFRLGSQKHQPTKNNNYFFKNKTANKRWLCRILI